MVWLRETSYELARSCGKCGLKTVVFNAKRDDAEGIDQATVSGFKALLDGIQLDRDGCVLQLLCKALDRY